MIKLGSDQFLRIQSRIFFVFSLRVLLIVLQISYCLSFFRFRVTCHEKFEKNWEKLFHSVRVRREKLEKHRESWETQNVIKIRRKDEVPTYRKHRKERIWIPFSDWLMILTKLKFKISLLSITDHFIIVNYGVIEPSEHDGQCIFYEFSWFLTKYVILRYENLRKLKLNVLKCKNWNLKTNLKKNLKK